MNRPATLRRATDPATTLDPPPDGDLQHWLTALSNGEGLLDPPPAGDDLSKRPTTLSYGESPLDLQPGGDDPKIGPPIPTVDTPDPPGPDDRPKDRAQTQPRELGGRPGPDPTRYGDWESKGRCIDF